MQLVTVSPKGQITIPKSARKLVNSKHLVFEMQGSTIILRPVNIQYGAIEINTNHIPQDTTLPTPFDFWNNTEDDIYEKFYSMQAPNITQRTSPLRAGTLILVPFVSSQSKEVKLRPALVLEVLHNTQEVVIAGVTSKKNEGDEQVQRISNEDLSSGKLPLISYVPLNKKTTIPQSVIQKTVGNVNPTSTSV